MRSKKPFRHTHGPFIPPVLGVPKDEIDVKTNRNAKMIQALLKPTVNGLFLFYLEGTGFSSTSCFMFPPGLNKEEAREFQMNFQVMFEKYARKAMNRSKKA